MRVLVYWVATVLLASTAAAAEVKLPAPPFSLQSTQGQPVSLAALQGKVVYLDFWASWCGPCRQSFPWMNQISKQFANDGLVVVAVNEDQQRDDADAFLKKLPADFTVVFDPQSTAAKAYAIKGMPSSFLIDRHGVVRSAHVGFRAESAKALEADIAELLKQP